MPASFPRQYELMYQKGTSDLALAIYALAIDDAEIADDMYDAQVFIDLLRKMKGYVATKIGKEVLS